MEKRLSSCKFYSHPNRCLCEHLLSVKNLSTTFAKEVVFEKFEIYGETIGKNEFIDCSGLIALSHDLGKATKFFQEHILEGKAGSRRSSHSLISAFIGFVAAKKKFTNSILPYILFAVVRNHHSDLDDFLNSFVIDNSDAKLLVEQWNSINKDGFFRLLEKIHFLVETNELEAYFNEGVILKTVRKAKREVRKLLRDSSKDLYFMFNLLFSILIDADKSDASSASNIQENIFARKQISANLIDKYLEKYIEPTTKKTRLNELRRETYQASVSKIDAEKHFYVLDAPTGIGKTLTSLSFALKLREAVQKEKGYIPRIIYAMPFLSIIDQNAEVMFDVFRRIVGREAYSNEVLVHHHLAGMVFKTSEFERDDGFGANLVESWNSEIIITTFIQLFYSLFTNKNKMLKKFHRIPNSIIILDEVQSIPSVYYKLLRETFAYMGKNFNNYVLLSTATQPLVLKGKPTVIPDSIDYSEINRFEIDNIRHDVLQLDVEELCRYIIEDLENNSEKDFLIIINTISYAEQVFKKIQTSGVNGEIIYLSSFVVPKERKLRIKRINSKNGKRKIVVSTQVVEAGVDIDLDIVYRDFAPFDSVVQSSGRCNRNRLEKSGVVKLFSIKDKRGRELWSYIYDLPAVEQTKKLLQAMPMDEVCIRKLAKEYAKSMSKIVSQSKSDEILAAIRKVDYQQIKNFQLIKEDILRAPVFIEADEDSARIWRKYCEISEIRDKFERKNKFLKIRKDFYDYVVSIPERILKENSPPEVNNFFYVCSSQINEYYNKYTGFKRKAGDGFW